LSRLDSVEKSLSFLSAFPSLSYIAVAARKIAFHVIHFYNDFIKRVILSEYNISVDRLQEIHLFEYFTLICYCELCFLAVEAKNSFSVLYVDYCFDVCSRASERANVSLFVRRHPERFVVFKKLITFA